MNSANRAAPVGHVAELDSRRLVARLRFRHLELLLMLRDGGSLRAAASLLHLTQPALSKMLREVEAAFGFALFLRGTRGLAPTPRGEIAIRGAGLLLQELAHLGGEAAAEPAVTVLRIGAPPFVAQGTLPLLLPRLLAGPAPLRVQLQEERVPLLVELLLAGRLDALISSYPTEMPEAAGRTLRYERLFDETFKVVAPRDHPLARARRVDWHRLGAETWIMPGPGSMVRHMLGDAFRREGVATPTPVIESTSPFTNLRLVAAGLGLCAVPESALEGHPLAAQVGRVAVRPPIPPGPVALIYRAAPVNPRVALLRVALEAPDALPRARRDPGRRA